MQRHEKADFTYSRMTGSMKEYFLFSETGCNKKTILAAHVDQNISLNFYFIKFLTKMSGFFGK